MRRRDFITLLVGAVICPFAARAEKNDGVRRVGVIMGFAENDEVWQAYLASFRQGLQEVGWTDGRNIRFDHRFPGDSEERMRAMAEEVVGLQPDVIFVSTNSVVSATLKATRSIPIVFTWVSDPVGSGFVANLPHPGGNITGFHNFERAIGGKWVAFLKQIAPDLRRVAVVHVPEIVPNVAFLFLHALGTLPAKFVRGRGEFEIDKGAINIGVCWLIVSRISATSSTDHAVVDPVSCP